MAGLSGLGRVGQAAERVGHVLEKVCGAFCVAIFASLIGVALLGVVSRYVMLHPLQWTEEAGRYLYVWMAFLAVSLATRRREHIALGILTSRLPSRLIVVLEVVIDCLCALFLLFLLKEGWMMTAKTMIRASTIPISMIWIHLSVPVAAGLSLIHLALNLAARLCRGGRASSSVTEPDQA
jgi:TRAP-type C4-dicarboxylate transport system permease small subunit